ncbi:S1/P1 nuclease [Arcicella aurantiaca]|uniref:S1/P1 nuclease n=1 Tax=Arcicella aurantiaca TaxID=591202 RepID=A0A316DK32_9BACT|nr:zinc dependent phospholipase C family protein [Arcicella aurantiaca]PWK17033.1 S1/P1 nuclease [Arcicella aurantiaca]
MKLPFLLKLSAIIFLLGLGSWGFLAHKTIHQIAIYSLPKKLQGFFFKNADYLVYNSVRPDVRRKDDPSEATKHFIDIDAPIFGENSIETMPRTWEEASQKYTADTLRKYGTVPWEIMKLQAKLTNAFRNKLKDSILFYSADLGHYIADAHVPLHTTVNYDGQMTNQRGLHSLWESTVPEMNIDNYNLYQAHKAKYIKNPLAEIWVKIRESKLMLDKVLADEIKASEGFTEDRKFKRSERFGAMRKNYSGEFAKAYAEKLGTTVNERMLDASKTVADFWFTAWVDAGCPDLSELQNISDEDKEKLKAEKKAWKSNELISKGLLQSRKGKSDGE